MTSDLNKLLKIAASNGVEAAIKIHIAKGDDLNARDDTGNTPLMIAAKKTISMFVSYCWKTEPIRYYLIRLEKMRSQ